MKKFFAVLLIALVAFAAFAEIDKTRLEVGAYLGNYSGVHASLQYEDNWEFGAFVGSTFPKALLTSGTTIADSFKKVEVGADALYSVYDNGKSKVQIGAEAAFRAEELKDWNINVGAEVSYRYTIDAKNRVYAAFVLPMFGQTKLQNFIDNCKDTNKGILKTVFETFYIGYSYKF